MLVTTEQGLRHRAAREPLHVGTFVYIYASEYSPGQRPIWRVGSPATSRDLSYDSLIWFQILFTVSVGCPTPPSHVDASTLPMILGAPRGTYVYIHTYVGETSIGTGDSKGKQMKKQVGTKKTKCQV